MKLSIDVQQSQWSEPFLEVVYSCGLNIVEAKKADVLVRPAASITLEDLESGRALIALEKTDGANIAFREIIKHRSVLRYIKSFNYNNYELHNSRCVDGRLFTRLLSNPVDWQQTELCITQTEYEKIELGWSFLNYSRLKTLRNITSREIWSNDDKRPIDVFFAGSLNYDSRNGERKSGDLISEHRLKCIQAIDALEDKKVFVAKGKLLSLETYNQLILNSKIVVSPWGWGECCYRDYEAILAGCILLKPKTSFVSSVCRLFEKPFCVWTSPDFSDLRELVDDSLKSYKEKRPLRKANRQAIIECALNLPSLVRRNLTLD